MGSGQRRMASQLRKQPGQRLQAKLGSPGLLIIAWGVGGEKTGVEAERARTFGVQLLEGCAGAGAASPKVLLCAGCSSAIPLRSPVC